MIAELENVKSVWPKVKAVLTVPANQREYNRLCRVMDSLVDEIAEDERHPLAPLLETVGSLLEIYEAEQVKVPDISAVDMLKMLMKEHGLTQVDLKEIASQGVLSEILHKKRSLNLRQIKLLAKRFNVSPAAFID